MGPRLVLKIRDLVAHSASTGAGIYAGLCSERRVQAGPATSEPFVLHVSTVHCNRFHVSWHNHSYFSLLHGLLQHLPIHGVVESRVLMAHMHDFAFPDTENPICPPRCTACPEHLGGPPCPSPLSKSFPVLDSQFSQYWLLVQRSPAAELHSNSQLRNPHQRRRYDPSFSAIKVKIMPASSPSSIRTGLDAVQGVDALAFGSY